MFHLLVSVIKNFNQTISNSISNHAENLSWCLMNEEIIKLSIDFEYLRIYICNRRIITSYVSIKMANDHRCFCRNVISNVNTLGN